MYVIFISLNGLDSIPFIPFDCEYMFVYHAKSKHHVTSRADNIICHIYVFAIMFVTL